MEPFVPHYLFGNTFLLTADRSIFWLEEKTLILADLHFGKTGHFRKSGIGVPQSLFKEDMQRLFLQLQQFKPSQIIIIGDMFHSTENLEHEFFIKWRKDFKQIPFLLVKGNHDILHESWYKDADIKICKAEKDSNCATLKMGKFLFTHDIQDPAFVPPTEEHFTFSGHIHPGVSINGIGKQSLRFPCFYFSKHYAVLPAYSKFTGTKALKPRKGDSVYAVVPSNASNGEQGGLIKI